MKGLTRVMLLFCLLAGLGFGAEGGPARTVSIALTTDPAPPESVLNPGGVVTISWCIQHATTPAQVLYRLEDPTRTLVLESEAYAGSGGLCLSRQWTVPAGLVDGAFWVRVEYWSEEIGSEASAEVCFLVSSIPSPASPPSWGALKARFR